MRNNEEYNNRSQRIESERGVVHANPEAIIRSLEKQNERLKERNEDLKGRLTLVRNNLGKVAIGVLLVFTILTGKIVYDNVIYTPDPAILPPGYVMTHIETSVPYNGNIWNTVDDYYDSSLYGSMYPNMKQYVNAIVEQSGIKYPNNVQPGQSLVVPVIISKDSEAFALLSQAEQLRAEIARIKQDGEYWVKHVVAAGESFSSLASKASGGYGDTADLTREIMSKNGRSSSSLGQGEEIWIVNPALGPLKHALEDAETAFRVAVKINQEGSQK